MPTFSNLPARSHASRPPRTSAYTTSRRLGRASPPRTSDANSPQRGRSPAEVLWQQKITKNQRRKQSGVRRALRLARREIAVLASAQSRPVSATASRSPPTASRASLGPSALDTSPPVSAPSTDRAFASPAPRSSVASIVFGVAQSPRPLARRVRQVRVDHLALRHAQPVRRDERRHLELRINLRVRRGLDAAVRERDARIRRRRGRRTGRAIARAIDTARRCSTPGRRTASRARAGEARDARWGVARRARTRAGAATTRGRRRDDDMTKKRRVAH